MLAKRREFSAGKLAKYRIEVGRAIGVLPKEIVGAIANEGGIEGKNIGQINLFDDYSTVELPADMPADMLANLGRIRVRQVPLRVRPLAAGEFIEDTRPPRSSKPAFKKEWKPDAPRADKKRPYSPSSPFSKPEKTHGDFPPRRPKPTTR